MYSANRRSHWDVDRLFLSFQLGEIVFIATVKVSSTGCSYFRGEKVEKEFKSVCRFDVSYCNRSLFIDVFNHQSLK